MKIRWKQGRVKLEKAGDFQAFKIVVESDARDLGLVRDAFGPLATFSDALSAWVSPLELRAWPGVKDDRAWQRGFDEMVKKASLFGWVDPLTGGYQGAR